MERTERMVLAPDIGGHGRVWRYGHWGRPVLVFPSERGEPWDWEDRGMIDAVADVIAAGRAKLYCVDTYDARSWSDDALPLEERARRYAGYERWIVEHVVPYMTGDSGGRSDVLAVGASMGAFHAVNLALKHAHRIDAAIGLSGMYDAERLGWGERGDTVYFNNPTAFVRNLDGRHLEWLRATVALLLVVGQGQWEDTTGALDSTRELAEVARTRQLRVELDVWGPEWPHDWPSWRAQIAKHLPRWC